MHTIGSSEDYSRVSAVERRTATATSGKAAVSAVYSFAWRSVGTARVALLDAVLAALAQAVAVEVKELQSGKSISIRAPSSAVR